MIWVIPRKKDRFLLAQRSVNGTTGGTWVFPGGKVDPYDTNNVTAAYRELREEIGIKGKRFRKISKIHIDNYNIHIFMCDQWWEEIVPSYRDVMGVGWFTLSEISMLDPILSPLVSDSIVQLSYLIQHYDNHPDEWKDKWRECDDGV